MCENNDGFIKKIDDLHKYLSDPFPMIFGDKWDTLAPREKQVVTLNVMMNAPFREIALNLGLSYSTVKNHSSRANMKLNVYGGTGQIRYLFYLGLMHRIEGMKRND